MYAFDSGLRGLIAYWHLAMDVSADLHELTRCPVGLVSSGVKSILDIGRSVVFFGVRVRSSQL